MIEKLKNLLCRLLCKDRLFNSDMSLEIDRLQARIDELEDKNNKVKEIIND